MQIVGIIMLVHQGIVPLVLLALGVQSKSWFAAMHLPEAVRLPAAVAFVVVGGALTLLGPRKTSGGR